jgi:hypothetical protein
MRPLMSASLQAEVAAEDEQVFGAGEIRVEIVELRHDADPRPRLLPIGRNGAAVQFDAAAIRPGQAEAQAQRGGLAGAVRAEQAETGTRFDGERQTGDHGLVAIGLAQVADV